MGVFDSILKRKRESVFCESLGKTSLKIWREVHESGDLSKLVIEGEPTEEEKVQAWHKLNNEFLKNYGLDRETKKIINLRFRLAKAMVDYLSSGNSSFYMEVKLLREDIKAFNGKSEESKQFIEIIAEVEQVLSFQIDEEKTTVAKFFSYIKQIKSQNKKQKENLKGTKNVK